MSFLPSHISTNKQDVWLLPTLQYFGLPTWMLLSSLINYLDNFEGTRVELFDTVVPQQLPAPFQIFSQALAIVFVLHGI